MRDKSNVHEGLMKIFLGTEGTGGGLQTSHRHFWHLGEGSRYYEAKEGSAFPSLVGKAGGCHREWIVLEPDDVTVVAWRSSRSRAMLIASKNGGGSFELEYVPSPSGGDSMYRELFSSPFSFSGKSGAGYRHYILKPREAVAKMRDEFVGPPSLRPAVKRVRKASPPEDQFVEILEEED